jgi:hypothetical protein
MVTAGRIFSLWASSRPHHLLLGREERRLERGLEIVDFELIELAQTALNRSSSGDPSLKHLAPQNL